MPADKERRCAHCLVSYSRAQFATGGARWHEKERRLWRCFVCEDASGCDRIVTKEREAAVPGSPREDWYLVKWNNSGAWHASWASAERLRRLSTQKLRNFERRLYDMEDLEESSYSIDEASSWGAADSAHLVEVAKFGLDLTRVGRVIAADDGTGDGTGKRKSPSPAGGKKTPRVLVKWLGAGYEDCTWELRADVQVASAVQMAGFEERRVSGLATPALKDLWKRCAKKTRSKPLQEQPEWIGSPERTLHGYQLEGINWLRSKWTENSNVILADEMGLGKTIQAAGLIASVCVEHNSLEGSTNGTKFEPALVVAPLSTLANWERELAVWCPYLHVVVVSGNVKARDLIRQHDLDKAHLVITSYEVASSERSALGKSSWATLIVDEGHRLKSGTRGKLFQDLSTLKTRHKVLLTGTPLQNSLDELHALLLFLDGGGLKKTTGVKRKKDDVVGEEDAAEEEEEVPEEETPAPAALKAGTTEDAEKRVEELRDRLGGRMLRRLKADVLKGKIPQKKELVVRVEMSELQKKLYRAVLTKNYSSLIDGRKTQDLGGGEFLQPASSLGSRPLSLKNVVMQLRKVCNAASLMEPQFEIEHAKGLTQLEQLFAGSAKLELMDRMLTKLQQQEHRVLVFSQMTAMLDVLEEYCQLKQYGYQRLDGSTPPRDRQTAIDTFNRPNSTNFLFLLSTRAGGLGINLATADTVVIFDQDWNPHNDLQALARAHRLGQRSTVMIYRLVTRASVEERILEVAKRKLCLESITIQSKQPLSRSELDDVLRYGAEELFSSDRSTEKQEEDAGDPTVKKKKLTEAELESAKAVERAAKYGDANSARTNKITYDDDAIDALLSRDIIESTGETAAAGDGDPGALTKLMQSFKVAVLSFEEEEQPEVAEVVVEEPKKEEEPGLFEWSDLLKEQVNLERKAAFEAHGYGKRERRSANVKGGAENAAYGIDNSDDSDFDEKRRQRRGGLPPDSSKRRRREEDAATRAASCLVVQNDKAFDQVATKLYSHGAPYLLMPAADWPRLHAHMAMQKKVSANPKTTRELVLKALDKVQKLQNVTGGDLTSERLAQRLGFFALLEAKLRAGEFPIAEEEEEEPDVMIIDGEEPQSNWDYVGGVGRWTRAHDLRLLGGVFALGYGRWERVGMHPELELAADILQELELKAARTGRPFLSFKQPGGAVTTEEGARRREVSSFVRERVKCMERTMLIEEIARQKATLFVPAPPSTDGSKQQARALLETVRDWLPQAARRKSETVETIQRISNELKASTKLANKLRTATLEIGKKQEGASESRLLETNVAVDSARVDSSAALRDVASLTARLEASTQRWAEGSVALEAHRDGLRRTRQLIDLAEKRLESHAILEDEAMGAIRAFASTRADRAANAKPSPPPDNNTTLATTSNGGVIDLSEDA